MNWYSPTNLDLSRQAHADAVRAALTERLVRDEPVAQEDPPRSRLATVLERLFQRRTLERASLGPV